MKRTLLAVAALIVALAATTPNVYGQVHGGVAPNRVPPPKPERNANQKGNKAPARAAAGRPQPYPLDRWASMPPGQREKELAKLAPERRQNLERRLQNWERMPEEQKNRIRNMTPEQRQLAAQHANWMREQPADRQPILRKQIQTLRQLSPEAREAELNSASFNRKFSPAEQEHIRQVLPVLAEPEQD